MAAEAPAGRPGAYTNSMLLHPPPVLNILVLDIVNLPPTDQMYLSDQLVRFMRQLPGGLPLSIYLHAGQYSVLLQDFTDDREKLLAAVQHALPAAW